MRTPSSDSAKPRSREIAVSSSILDGKAVGFVVDTNRRWVARIDLAAMAGLRPASGVSLSVTEMAPVVTYLDGQNRLGSTPDGGYHP